MVVFLKTTGHTVNRKRVQDLMRGMGVAGMAPGPNTSRPHPEHKVYPYLFCYDPQGVHPAAEQSAEASAKAKAGQRRPSAIEVECVP